MIITEETMKFNEMWNKKWKPIFESIWKEFGESLEKEEDRGLMMEVIGNAELLISNRLWEISHNRNYAKGENSD